MEERVEEGVLLEAVGRGEEGAFRRLYRLHSEYVFRHALRLTGGSDADAHDVLQETWLRAVRGLARFEQRSSVRTWLCSIATRTAWELLRTRRRSLGDEELGEPAHLVASHATERVDLERMLARMPDGYRTVLVLHDVQGMKHLEIAELMGVSEGTSKSQLSRARAWARRAMGETYTRR